jgi:hypothetical protein
VRTKVIIFGGLATLALAAVTANAGNRASQAVQGSMGSTASVLTAVRTLEKASDLHVGIRSTTSAPVEPTARPVAALKPANRSAVTVSAACQEAVNALKALHQADVAKALQWKNALTAARNACLPQRSAACQVAIDSLQALVQANRLREWSELAAMFRNRTWQTELASLKPAFAAVAQNCTWRQP